MGVEYEHSSEPLHTFVKKLFFQEAAKAESRQMGSLCSLELLSLYASARLHEVLDPQPPTAHNKPYTVNRMRVVSDSHYQTMALHIRIQHQDHAVYVYVVPWSEFPPPPPTLTTHSALWGVSVRSRC